MSITEHQPRLGLRANLAQFCLLVLVNALVGGMVGQEQTVLPLLAEQHFHLTGYTFLLTYVFAFGITKAATNYFAGTWSDRFGRKPVLLAGWLIAIPVPLMLIWAPSWGWVVAANGLLGVNQGLTWSTTVIMKIDLVGPRQRGLAMGFNEAAGYGAVAITALLAGYLGAHYGLRPAPFLLGLSYALIALVLCAVFVRETRGHAQLEASHHGNSHPDTALTNRQIFLRTSITEPALSAASQAGLVNNLNFGLSWGLFPILFASTGITVERVGILVAIYPAVWGVGQIITGALSDRWGRKHLITTGMLIQAGGLALIATGDTFAWWMLAGALLGAGTAMVYPTLLAAVGDVAHPLVARPRGRRLPALARQWLCRRGDRRWRHCRPVGATRRDLGSGRHHRRIRCRRCGAHVRNPPNRRQVREYPLAVEEIGDAGGDVVADQAHAFDAVDVAFGGFVGVPVFEACVGHWVDAGFTSERDHEVDVNNGLRINECGCVSCDVDTNLGQGLSGRRCEPVGAEHRLRLDRRHRGHAAAVAVSPAGWGSPRRTGLQRPPFDTAPASSMPPR